VRVLFTTLPGFGNLHPLVPVAIALREAGHEVAFACARSFCPLVERLGFRCFAAGFDWTLAERDAVFAEIRSQLGRSTQAFTPLNDVFATFLPPLMIADLLQVGRAWSADLIVRDPLEFGGCVAAEAMGLPHAACGPLFALWDGAWHDEPGEVARPNFDAVRGAYGLAPDPQLAMLHRWLYLALLPPAFVGPALTIPPSVHFLRPISFDDPGSEPAPAWLERLPARPTVHASLGTVFHRTPGIFEAILEALRDEPINLILAIGRDQDPAQLGPQPSNTYIERYIPHSLLLRRCDLAIVHGGYGSVMACLNEGVPMVVIPVAGDQPANAARCVALGVGRVVLPGRRSPETIRAEVRGILREPRYAAHAARLREVIELMPGLDRAVALLEELAPRERTADPTNRVEPSAHWAAREAAAP
jgi:MGT family glycosyltransferase